MRAAVEAVGMWKARRSCELSKGGGETVENRDRGKFLPVLAPRPVFHPASTARHFHGLSLPPTPHGFFRTARILR
jgi:hypothetical protein